MSGGERQRIAIARGLLARRPVLLLGEPSASLDADNGGEVVTLIGETRERRAAIAGIFHDAAVPARVRNRCDDVKAARKAA